MKRINKGIIGFAALAMLSACSRPNPPQVPMTQMCGIDPQTGQQNCIMVPQNQMASYNQQGYYQYQNGQYRDSHGDAVAAAVVAGAAGYMLGRHQADQRDYDNRRYNNSAYNDRGYDNRQQAYTSNPVTGTQRSEYVPQNAKTAVTGKAPTGGLMAGHTDIKLSDTATPATKPASTFTPTAAKSFAPTQAPATPMFKPTAMSKPMPAPSTFTPSSASRSFTPTAAKSTPSFKPSSFKSSSSSSFKPSSSRKK